MFGKLTLKAFEHSPVQNISVVMMPLTGILIIALLFYYKGWKTLWNDWLTSVDPKKIGIMYLVVVLLMLLKGFVDAAMMRVQQAMAVGDAQGFLSAEHFQQVFSAHGTTMIFFVGMGVIFALMNLVVPLQIGARDVAFPFLNAVSFWLFATGGMLIMISLAIGNFSTSGWLAYPPLSGPEYSPNEGVNYWIWIVQIAGVGSTLAGINFLVTILKMRCPGMTLMKMPMFIWSVLGALILIIFAFPILTATLGMLTLDRYIGTHFFTAGFGGNPMMYVNLIWAWGHPEVYILILPAFGVYSEVVATFSRKKLFGYVSMVWAIIVITVLSFIVWLHHFFTMGAGPEVNIFFAIMTMLIAIPTGVKIFNWLFTKYQGRIHLNTPMLWFLGFVLNFTVGGMTGVLLSAPPIDYEMHNSLFLIAHFHGVIIGGVVFGFFAGFTYWFPKIFGFKLNERLGIYAFWCWFIGFLVAFMPLYMLGFMGATRRLDHYEANLGWHPLFVLVTFGVIIIACGIGLQILQLVSSFLKRHANQDLTGDPWNGRTLEWTTTSPPPIYNFSTIPTVETRDQFWVMKHSSSSAPIKPHYEDIDVPKNTPIPFFIGCLSTIFGFALTWHISWMAWIGFIGVIACLVLRLSLSDNKLHYTIPASEVEKIEKTGRKQYA